jgi:hypothetical protein
MADFQKTNIISEKIKRMKAKQINVGNLLQDEKELICGKSANMYKSFEKEFEKQFKKNTYFSFLSSEFFRRFIKLCDRLTSFKLKNIVSLIILQINYKNSSTYI